MAHVIEEACRRTLKKISCFREALDATYAYHSADKFVL
jgi:hypothetical protein